MAAIAATVTDIYLGKIYRWTPLTAADTATAIEVAGYVDKSVQFTGTFGNATVVMKGSNDGAIFENLTDPQGNDISKTAADLEQITEATRHIQPTFSGGDGTQSVSVTVFAIRR
jgi:hypothetical protein